MLQRLRLLGYRAGHDRVVIANTDGQVLTQAIEVAVTFFIPQVLILTLAENQRFLVGHEGALRCGEVAIAPLDDGLGAPVQRQLVVVVVKLGCHRVLHASPIG